MNIQTISKKASVLAGLVFFFSCIKPPSGTAGSTVSLKRLENFQNRQFEFGNINMLEGYPNGFVTNMAASPKHRRLFLFQLQYRAGEEDTGYIPDKPQHGLWTSKNDGTTWMPVSFEGRIIYDLVVDDLNDLIYISTNKGDIQFSEDLGESWKLRLDGSSRNKPATGRRRIRCLSIDPANGRLFGRVNYNGAGIYEINKQETGWHRITSGLPEDFSAFDVCYSPEEEVLYVINGNSGFIPITPRESELSGLYRGIRKPDGYQWTRESGLPDHEAIDPAVISVTIDPGTGIPYASTITGLYRRTDGLWQLELAEEFIQSVAFESKNTGRPQESPSRAVAMSMNRLFIRDDNEWRQLEYTPWHPDATLGTILYFNGAVFISMNDGLWVTRDGGENWIRKRIGMGEETTNIPDHKTGE